MNILRSIKVVALTSSLVFSTHLMAIENGDYAIDSVHSTVSFTVDHLGYTPMLGRFNNVAGEVKVEKGLANINFTIKAASVDTNHEKRDDHLRSPDFFNVKQFPTITFKSNGMKLKDKGKLTGMLTLLGKKKPIELTVKQGKAAQDPWGLYRVGYVATGTIKRSDFGMNFMQGGLGDEIKLNVFIEATKN